MRIIFAFLFLLIQLTVFSQNQIVNVEDPIADVDVVYTKQDGVTRLIIILNTVESDQETNNVNNNFEALVNIQGLIFWKNPQSNPKKNILKKATLQKLGEDKPFVLFADLYDGENNLLKKPSSTNSWEKISFNLNYIFNGISGKLPTINLYPPIENKKPVVRTINVSYGAKQKKIRQGIIELRSSPAGTPFEITELKVVKKLGGNSETTILDASELGNSRFSYNGEMNLSFNTSFDIETRNAKYFIYCKASVLGDKNAHFANKETEVVFVQDFELEILNRKEGYEIVLSSESKEYQDKNIKTKGNGRLGIRFLNTQYQKNVRPIISAPFNGEYNIRLEGLQSLPSETSSTFFYTDDSRSKDISGPFIISKKLPKLSNFSFNGANSDSLLMSFKLPTVNNGKLPEISLSGDKGGITLGGKLIVKKRKLLEEKDRDMYDVVILKPISSLLSTDEVVKDLSISVLYGDNTLYSLTVTVFNQKLYEEKMAELKTETDKKRKHRDKEKIKKIVEEILKIGTAIGNSIGEEEVSKAIDGLQTGKSDKVKAVMGDIGQWALIAGKIVLPLLL